VKPAKLQFSVNGPLVSTWRPTFWVSWGCSGNKASSRCTTVSRTPGTPPFP